MKSATINDNYIMKRFLLLTAALLAFVSCNDKKPLDNPKDDEVKESISLNSNTKSFSKDGGTADIKVTSTGAWTLTSDEAYDWVTPSAKSGKSGDVVKFTVTGNKTSDEKKAVFTFKTGKEATAVLEITVAAGEAPYLNSDTKSFELKENGGTIEVKVNSNIEYTYTPDANWISYKETKSGNVEVFTVAALPAGTDSRSGKIAFAGKDNSSLKFDVTVSQKRDASGGDDALITTVGKFNATRAYPKWDGNATVFENMSEFTVEALVYHRNGWVSLNTILGIDGYFMVRAGDDGIQKNEIQVCTSGDETNEETKLNSGVQLEENTWYHIAVTFNNGAIKLYIDGVEKGSITSTATTKRSFNREHTDESGGWGATRCFWVGYSCGVSRCWKGMMSEVRIWNKVLTASDLTAKNHFYKVDPDSAGLIAYWKFNDGEGSVVKDHTSNGNNLYCQINVKNDPPTTATGEDGMEWETVSLPE